MNQSSSEITNDNKWLMWKATSTSVLTECKIFTVKQIKATSQCGQRKEAKFFTLDCGAWVNIIAMTSERDVILVEQYRHGVGELTVEIPGGCVDDTDADVLAAAIRELREETGCVAEQWSYLGKNHPNPAMQNNFCYTYLAEGVRQIEPPRFDGSGTEKIIQRLVPLHEIENFIRTGIITHSLVITAFHYLAIARPELVQSKS